MSKKKSKETAFNLLMYGPTSAAAKLAFEELGRRDKLEKDWQKARSLLDQGQKDTKESDKAQKQAYSDPGKASRLQIKIDKYAGQPRWADQVKKWKKQLEALKKD